MEFVGWVKPNNNILFNMLKKRNVGCDVSHQFFNSCRGIISPRERKIFVNEPIGEFTKIREGEFEG